MKNANRNMGVHNDEVKANLVKLGMRCILIN
jgi:hypothetical protein